MGVAAREPGGWSGRTVLMTGAAGFLGRAVSQQLVDGGAVVVGLDIDWAALPPGLQVDGVKLVDGDVRNGALLTGLLDASAIDTVIHLAAQTLVGPAIEDPATTYSNNVEGTWTLLEACRRSTGLEAIVVASSDKAYGDWSGRPYREDMALRASHPYDTSKAAADLISQSYSATYNLPVGITRCGNLYGGGDRNWSRVVPGTIRSVLERERPVIRSDGMFVRDYLHVSDAADGVLALGEALRGRQDLHGSAFNFATGSRPTVIHVVRRILGLLGSSLEPVVLGRDLAEIREQRLSWARAKRILGWRPRMTLDAGLQEAIGWYRDNLPLLR